MNLQESFRCIFQENYSRVHRDGIHFSNLILRQSDTALILYTNYKRKKNIVADSSNQEKKGRYFVNPEMKYSTHIFLRHDAVLKPVYARMMVHSMLYQKPIKIKFILKENLLMFLCKTGSHQKCINHRHRSRAKRNLVLKFKWANPQQKLSRCR